jgi:hypothetical protein
MNPCCVAPASTSAWCGSGLNADAFVESGNTPCPLLLLFAGGVVGGLARIARLLLYSCTFSSSVLCVVPRHCSPFFAFAVNMSSTAAVSRLSSSVCSRSLATEPVMSDHMQTFSLCNYGLF